MRRLAGIGGLILVLVVFGVGQLVLPGIAASVLRDRLARSGRVLSVHVSAFPAIELLWHSADQVDVRMATYRSDLGHLNSLLADVGNVGTVNASVGRFESGLLTLRRVSFRKRGNVLLGSAQLLDSDLRAAVPFLQSVQFVRSDTQGLTLQGTATLLGVSASVTATVQPQGGNLVVVPDVPLGGLATVPVFSSPRIAVTSVSGAPISGGLDVSAQASLR